MILRSWLLLFVCFFLLQNLAKAETIYTTVFNVFESIKTDRLLVLSAADGRIYKIAKSEDNKKKLNSLIGKVVRLDFYLKSKEAIISNINPAQAGEIDEKSMDLNHFQYNQLRTFAPTDVKSLEEANLIFQEMINDGDRNRSQCFKRAHMWAYDMWSNLGMNTQKMFVFYTKRYQILEEFDWWFHVAPLITVNGEDYLMDGTFMKKPTLVADWISFFLETDKISCPEINRYQQFTNYQWNRLCYVMKVPMYYFRPFDIESRDLSGVERNHWKLEELQDARRAFRNYETTYEGLDNGQPTEKY